MRILILIVFSIFLHIQSIAQESDTLKSESNNPIKGTLGLRSYWMSTGYWEDFKGDFALGQSAFLQLRTKDWKGFSFVGRYSVFANIMSSDLLEADPVTGNFNRYEVGLFDVDNPEKKYFGKLEELQLRYNSKKFSAILGRMGINTPFINPQDGRLSPTFVEGIQLTYIPKSNHQLSTNLIRKISPRSTSQWYSVGGTFGLYPEGQSVFGQPSGYFGNTTSDFVSILEWKFNASKQYNIQLNHTYVENISSTVFTQVLKDWDLKGTENKLVTGLQLIVQEGVGKGGNEDPLKRFKQPDDLNIVLSARLGMKNQKLQWWANYTRIDGRGRFLSPREWGRDPFFTFIPRERNEGFNQVDAFTLYFQRDITSKGLQMYGFSGLHFLPDPYNVEVNKFGFPSYAQMNIGAKYVPVHWGKGLDFHIIGMSKLNIKSGEIKPQWIYNKVNLLHLNFIVNYTIQWE